MPVGKTVGKVRGKVAKKTKKIGIQAMAASREATRGATRKWRRRRNCGAEPLPNTNSQIEARQGLSYEEEDTCHMSGIHVMWGGYMSYEEDDTCHMKY